MNISQTMMYAGVPTFQKTPKARGESPSLKAISPTAHCTHCGKTRPFTHDARELELIELLEVARETHDDDMREILEAELFACGLFPSGGRDV